MKGLKKNIALFYSVFVKAYLKVRHGRRIVFGKGIIVNFKFSFRGSGRLVFGNDVNLWAHEESNRFFTYGDDVVIEVGDGCRLNGVTIQAKKGVRIGRKCLIGSSMIIDTDFHSVDYRFRNDHMHVKSARIEIGDDVWLAGQSVILKGVVIGDRAVVGMRAVVTREIPKGVVVAGNPAQVVRELEFSD
jgi:maltose O-acetyltransferase